MGGADETEKIIPVNPPRCRQLPEGRGQAAGKQRSAPVGRLRLG